MSKKAIFICAFVIVLGLSFYVGFTFQKNSHQNDIIKNDMIFDDDKGKKARNETIEIVSQDEKTTPNTMLVLKKYYTDCGHIIGNSATMPEEMVNLTETQIRNEYPNWEIEKFGVDEVVLTKTLDSFCGEHYYVTEENGYISIYTMDEEENKTLKESGKLSCEYLPETDRIGLRRGIMIYGTEELNKMLEDFES